MGRTKLTVAVILLGACLVAGAVSAVQGARRAMRGPSGTFRGMIDAVAGNTVRVNVAKDEEQSKILIFWTDARTSVLGGVDASTINDLESGQTVTVKARNGHADSIKLEGKDDQSGKDKKDKKDKKNNKGKSDKSAATQHSAARD